MSDRPTTTDGMGKPVTTVLDHDEQRRATDALITEHLPLVQHVVNSVAMRYPRHVDRDELWNAGAYGLVDAARRYDPATGIPFGRYATIRIRGAIIDSTRTRDWASRGMRRDMRALRRAEETFQQANGRAPSTGELADALDCSVEQVERTRAAATATSLLHLDQRVGAPGGEEQTLADLLEESTVEHRPEQHLEEQELSGTLHYAVTHLPDTQREVVERYYFAGEYLRDIAETLGVTEARVSQIRSEAVNAIRAYLGTAFDGVPPVEETAPGRRRREDYVSTMRHEGTWRDRLDASARPLALATIA